MGRIIDSVKKRGLSRRDFVGASAMALATLGVGLAGCTPKGGQAGNNSVVISETPIEPIPEGEWVSAVCWSHCGGKCAMSVYKTDNVLLRMKTDDTHEDSMDWPQRRCCLRGHSRIEDVLGADRLKYPMKRKNWQPGGETINGELRGVDEWERLSWDEALDIVASEITRIKERYGNKAIFGSGYNTAVSSESAKGIGMNATARDLEWVNVLNAYGGQVYHKGTASSGSFGSAPGYYGYRGRAVSTVGNDRFDARNCDYYVFLGFNPAYSADGSTLFSTFLPLMGPNKKFYVIDPQYSDTAAVLGAEWVPIRPGTDLAFLNAVAYTMITEDDPANNPLVDWDIIERCTLGFDADHMPEGAPQEDNFKDYILGTYDGQPKNPEWAYEICGVDPEKTREIARVLRKDNKVAFCTTWGPGRTNNSEGLSQILMIVSALGGHFGQSGHIIGDSIRDMLLNNTKPIIRNTTLAYPYISNEVDDVLYDAVQWKSMVDKKYIWTSMNGFLPAEERNIDIKCLYNYSLNLMHRTEGLPAMVEAVRQMEFVVTHAFQYNSNALYSDIVLPIITPWENYPLYLYTGNTEFALVGGDILEPLYECKPAQWIGEQLMERWGLDPKLAYPKSIGQTFFDWIAGAEVLMEDGATYEKLVSFTPEEIAAFDAEGEPQEGRISYTEFRKNGVYAVKRSAEDKYGIIGLKGFREDPDSDPVASESGKMEFYCKAINEVSKVMGYSEIPPLPEYVPPLGGYQETFENGDIASGRKSQYPYQIFNPHYPRSSHAHFDNIPWLREAFIRPVFMNELDATDEGLQDGDIVRIWNTEGSIVRPLCTTKRMMRGVIGVTHGGWFELDEDGNDLGGAANTLCVQQMAGLRVDGYNTNVGAIERYTKDFTPDAQRLNVAPACQA
jgi:anaerobic dimethyl sulfoxide reductase subunit A